MAEVERTGAVESLTRLFVVEAVGHVEAEGGEEQPAVLLVVYHQINRRSSSS